jgi:hypothetical protein
MGSTHGAKERFFFEYLAAYDRRLSPANFTLYNRQQMGCGSRLQPDALLKLQTHGSKATTVEILDTAATALVVKDDKTVIILIELDENFHRSYQAACELKRLEEIKDQESSPLFALRYNIDQEGGMSPEKLDAFCERALEVLDGAYQLAIEAPTGMVIEYHGYPEQREDALVAEFMRQQEYD